MRIIRAMQPSAARDKITESTAQGLPDVGDRADRGDRDVPEAQASSGACERCGCDRASDDGRALPISQTGSLRHHPVDDAPGDEWPRRLAWAPEYS